MNFSAILLKVTIFAGSDCRSIATCCNPDYSRIINATAVRRLAGLIDPAKVIAGGQSDEDHRYVAPTLLYPISWSDMANVEIATTQIQRGEIVTNGHAAVNLDPAQSAAGYTRQSNRHLVFGHGIHYCGGAGLARVEGTIAISTVLRRMPRLAK